MAKRHLLSLPKKASYYSSKFVVVGDVKFKFTLYVYDNASGFVHFAILSTNNGYTHVLNDEDLAHAKAQYYNRTWEKYTGQSVFKEALNWALKSNDITQAEYNTLKEDLE